MKPYVVDSDTLTYSMLSAYLKCPASFEKMYGPEKIPWQERVPIGPLIAGSAVHEVIEEAEPDEKWRSGKEFLVAVFREKFAADVKEAEERSGHKTVWAGTWRNVRNEDGTEIKVDGKTIKSNEDYQWWFNHGARLMLGNYVDQRHIDTENGITLMPEGTEMKVRVALPGLDQALRVTIDAFLYVNQLTGEFKIRDWKSGRTGGADEKQLAVYYWGAKEAGIGLPNLEFAYLRENSAEKRLKTMDLSVLAEYVPVWFRKLHYDLEFGEFPPLPSKFNCRGCQVKPWCEAGTAMYGEEVVAE